MSKSNKFALVLTIFVFLFSSLMLFFHSITDKGSVHDVVFYAWLALAAQINGYDIINNRRDDE